MSIACNESRSPASGPVRDAMRGDARLVAALRDGEDGAFARLVTTYENAVRNVAYGLVRNREDARDVAQEVFLRAYLQIPKLQGEVHLWAWLYRVTVNACWDHLRAGSRRPVVLLETPDDLSERAMDDLARAELAQLFAGSLERLPPMQQAALVLKDVHGMQHSEIASTLGISRGSSEVLLFRARRSFRVAFRAMTEAPPQGPACDFAERAAAYSVGGRLTDGRSRRVIEHAKGCPSCRRTVERWCGTRLAGLGLALPHLVPQDLFGAPGAASATASVAPVAASSVAPVAAATLTPAATSLTPAAASALGPVLGDLAAKLAGCSLAKAAAVALAATVVTTGGVAAVHDGAQGGQRPHRQAAAAASAATLAANSGPGAPAPAGEPAARPAPATTAASATEGADTPAVRTAPERSRPVRRGWARQAAKVMGVRGPASRRAVLEGRAPKGARMARLGALTRRSGRRDEGLSAAGVWRWAATRAGREARPARGGVVRAIAIKAPRDTDGAVPQAPTARAAKLKPAKPRREKPRIARLRPAKPRED